MPTDWRLAVMFDTPGYAPATAERALVPVFGISAVEYDALDHLTCEDRYGFLNSCSDTPRMAEFGRNLKALV